MLIKWMLSLALVAPALVGCAALSDDDGEVRVAAAFYPLEFVAERVAGDYAKVTTLVAPGKEPHDAEMTIRETAEVANADLVIHQHDFQPAVDEAIEQNASGEVLDVTDVIDLVPADEHDEEEVEHEEDHEGHDHGDLDPHFWLDPLRLADVGDAVADKLAEIDPKHATAYADNAAALRTDLEQLDADFTTGLADCDRDVIVVSHNAFGYLERYGLHPAPVVGLSPDAEPNPATIADVQQLIEDEQITTVFSERLAPKRLTEPLAEDLGLKTAVLDPIEGLTDDTADEDYVSLMRANLAALKEANGCR